jgi:hypothetical protein
MDTNNTGTTNNRYARVSEEEEEGTIHVRFIGAVKSSQQYTGWPKNGVNRQREERASPTPNIRY